MARRSLPLFIAGRYLRSRRSHSVINLITWVSSVAVAVPVAAMIILLSVFNGFEGMVRSMFTYFDPDIMVTVAQGKSFDPKQAQQKIAGVKGVENTSFILDENALLVYGGHQYIGTVRGADQMFDKVIPIEKAVDGGRYQPYFGDMPQALLGRGMAYNLGVNHQMMEPVKLYVPRRGSSFSSLLPLESFRSGSLFPSGVFALDAQTDGEYIIVPLEFAQSLFGYGGKVSGIMVKVGQGASSDRVKAELKKVLGEEFSVKDRYEQKVSLYRVMTSEKWGIFFIILLVLVVSSCAVVGSLVMLIIDKKEDIFTLSVMGAGRGLIRKVFVGHAMMISMIGAVGGLLLGLAVCLAQQYLGIVPMPADSFLMESYPVEVHWSDVAVVAASFTLINYIIIKFTASIMIKEA